MDCPSCGHTNLSDFPFCEQCLETLPPERRWVGDDLGTSRPSARRRWPPFPWNPDDLADPLIGRTKAFKSLKSSLADVVARGEGRVHLLVSEYGMGKSRLGRELRVEGTARWPNLRVERVRCPPQGGVNRLWEALVNALFSVPTDADETAKGAALKAGIVSALGDESAFYGPALAWLVGVQWPDPDPATIGWDATALTGRATTALAKCLTALAAAGPLVVMIDYAHRAQAVSLALVAALEPQIRSAPVMLVLSGAPELAEAMPGWDRFPVTRVGALTRGEGQRMLGLFLEGLGPVPAEFRERVVAQAKGNAYAIKSMVRYARASGAFPLQEGTYRADEGVLWDLDLPDSLEGVVLARFGQFPAELRVVLGHAAVIGERFWLGALVALRRVAAAGGNDGERKHDDAPALLMGLLERLERAGFIERRASRISTEVAFGFRSEAHRAVVLDVVPEARAQAHHRVIYQWLSLHAEHLGDAASAELAHHAKGAGHPTTAAGHLLTAAGSETARHRPELARRHLEAASALVDRNALSARLPIDLALGAVMAETGALDGALEHLNAALRSAWRLRQRRHGARALMGIAGVHRERGRFDAAGVAVHEALTLFETIGDRSGVARACVELGRLSERRGRLDDAERAYRRAQEGFRAERDQRGLAEAIHHLGVVVFDRGFLDGAQRLFEEAIEFRRRVDDRRGLGQTLNALAVIEHLRGATEDAIEIWREARAIAETLGDPASEAALSNNLGEALLDSAGVAALDEVEPLIARALEIADAIDLPHIALDARRNRAVAEALRGHLSRAQKALSAVRNDANRLGLPRISALALRSEAVVVAMDGGARPGAIVEARRRAAVAFEAGGYLHEASVERGALAADLDGIGRARDAKKERAAQQGLERQMQAEEER